MKSSSAVPRNTGSSLGSKGKVAAGGLKPSARASTATHKTNFLKAFASAAADVAGQVKPLASGNRKVEGGRKQKEKIVKDLHYKNLIDPKNQKAKKQEYLAAFEKLKAISIEEMQVRPASKITLH